MLYGEVRSSSVVGEMTVYPLHRAELRLADIDLRGRPYAERCAVDEAVRTRGAAYLARFRHTTELSWRMPVLFAEALQDGRMTIDHFDTVWRRLDRHPGVRARIDAGHHGICHGGTEGGTVDGADSGASSGAGLPEPENGRSLHIDQVVEKEVLDWMRGVPRTSSADHTPDRQGPGPVLTVHRLGTVVDRAADEAVGDLAGHR